MAQVIDVVIKNTTLILCIRPYGIIPSTILLVMKAQLLNKSLVQFPDRDWDLIKSWCKDRSGVYAFVNNLNGKYYIGSAVNLYNRLRDYHQPWYQKVHANDVIMRAILKYGMANFTILILEFTDPNGAVPAEQTWMDTYRPEYNVLTKAGNTLGYVHTEEDKPKIMEAMAGKPRSLDVRNDMSKRQMGSGNTFYGKTHSDEAKALLRAAALARVSLHKPGFAVSVKDTTTGITTPYVSLRKAAEALKCTRPTLQKYNGLLFRDRYMITMIDNSPNSGN